MIGRNHYDWLTCVYAQSNHGHSCGCIPSASTRHPPRHRLKQSSTKKKGAPHQLKIARLNSGTAPNAQPRGGVAIRTNIVRDLLVSQQLLQRLDLLGTTSSAHHPKLIYIHAPSQGKGSGRRLRKCLNEFWDPPTTRKQRQRLHPW